MPRAWNEDPPGCEQQILPNNSVWRALEQLRNIGIARSDGREWTITDPLLARYLRELDPLP